MDMGPPDWIRRRYSVEYVRYLEASLSPTAADAAELASAREALHMTSIAREVVEKQRDDGGWTPDSPELWYQGLPHMLGLLLDYGFTPLDEPVARGLGYLRSLQHDDGAFHEDVPGAIAYDEAFNAGCIRTLVSAGLRGQPCARLAAQRLLAARRHDAGWSTLPPWMRSPGQDIPDPEPSCPICTFLAMRALGCALDLPQDTVGEFLETGMQVTPSMPPSSRAGQHRERLRFMAEQGLIFGDPIVDAELAALEDCRDADGRFPRAETPASWTTPELAEVETRHLRWRLGAPLA